MRQLTPGCRKPHVSGDSLQSLFICSSKAESCSSKLSKGVCCDFDLLCSLLFSAVSKVSIALYLSPFKLCIMVSFNLILFTSHHPGFNSAVFIFLKGEPPSIELPLVIHRSVMNILWTKTIYGAIFMSFFKGSSCEI